MTKLRLAKRYFTDVWQLSPSGASTSLLLSLFLAVTEGAGLLLIIPMLGLLGLSDDQQNSALVSKVLDGITAVGIPFNLKTILILYVGIIAFYAVVKYIQSVLTMKLSLKFVQELRLDSYKNIARSQWGFFSSQRLSELSTHLVSQMQTLGRGYNQLVTLSTTVALLIIYLVIAMDVSVTLSAITMAGMVVLLSVSTLVNRGSYKSGDREQGFAKKIHRLIIEGLGGIKTAKIYQREEALINDFNKTLDGLAHNMLRFGKINGRVTTFLTIGGAIWIALMVYIAVSLEIGTDKIIIMALIFSRIHPVVLRLYKGFIMTSNILPAYKSVSNFNHLTQSVQDIPTVNAAPKVHLTKEFELESVTFAYGENEIFKDFSIRIPAGSITLLKGPSGAGKSTLIDLIIGLLEPSAGSRKIDGKPLTREYMMGFQQQIAYVEQTPFFFHDTIRQNLLFAKESATDQEMIDCLKKAAAYEFVMALPNQLDTQMGDRGLLLSGGEKQRLALARALLRAPQLMLLDEATNALDEENEKKVFDTLIEMKGKVTIIIVSHKQEIPLPIDQVIRVT